jgi:WD40 repeat protein/mono/diheme cytochrome c family protein
MSRDLTSMLFRLGHVLPCLLLAIGLLHAVEPAAADDENKADASAEPVSFYRQVRPILQRHCAGCHQPAKLGGTLLLTSFEGLKTGGENGSGFEPGKPDESLVIDYISGDEPLMPLNEEPLEAAQVSLIARWIQEGAKNDTPEAVQDSISAENPPVYAGPPVITSLAYSPDSRFLAVSGFHEILLHKADGSGLEARFVGRAQRLESIAFSPDGNTIGAVGGTPALFGEVQFWNIPEKKLTRSVTISYDTLFGASFSDDGSQFAFGGADNRARVLRVADAEQLMRFDAHADWVFGTTFSKKLDHLITVSRDMSMKLVIVESGQFVDNITSITPGALKGGLMAVQRHPGKDQVLTGGADGEPMLYKVFQTRKRIIGDDFNRIRAYQKMPGRIFDLEFNADGSQFVAGSSSATGGAARIYNTGEFESAKINTTGDLGDTRRETAERSQVQMLAHELAGIDSPIFAVAFRPDGKQVAVGGFDGMVKLYDTESGVLVKEFVPVEITAQETAAK